jgi:hypothetical protein
LSIVGGICIFGFNVYVEVGGLVKWPWILLFVVAVGLAKSACKCWSAASIADDDVWFWNALRRWRRNSDVNCWWYWWRKWDGLWLRWIGIGNWGREIGCWFVWINGEDEIIADVRWEHEHEEFDELNGAKRLFDESSSSLESIVADEIWFVWLKSGTVECDDEFEVFIESSLSSDDDDEHSWTCNW